MQDVMFETLLEILALESENCRAAALHGLGHLRHPKTEEAISEYIHRHPSLSEEARAMLWSRPGLRRNDADRD